MSMIKWEVVYATIAAKHGCSASYVKRIDRKELPTNSDKAKAIKKALDQAVREFSRASNAVAA